MRIGWRTDIRSRVFRDHQELPPIASDMSVTSWAERVNAEVTIEEIWRDGVVVVAASSAASGASR